MQKAGIVKRAVFAVALLSCAAPPAEALEIVSTPGAHRFDDMTFVTQVRHVGARPGGVHRPAGGGVHRPAGYRPPGGVHRPPGYRPPGARPPAYRPAYRPPVVRGPVVWGARPGWYRWPAGGAVAAGAALGFVTAASATAWAGAPPQSGLCWYYTDPSRRQGFWDVCP